MITTSTRNFQVRKKNLTKKTHYKPYWDFWQKFEILYLFLGGLDGKESACNAGDLVSISGSGTSPGEGNGYLLQYSCLEKSMDRGAWWATVHEVAKSWTVSYFLLNSASIWPETKKHFYVMRQFMTSILCFLCGVSRLNIGNKISEIPKLFHLYVACTVCSHNKHCWEFAKIAGISKAWFL